MPGEGVSVAFYRELLKVIAEVEHLKAEFAYWKADEQQERLRTGRTQRKVKRQPKA
jgi:aspartate ammonia-lyase